MNRPGPFRIVSDFKPTGDQPTAIDQLVEGINAKRACQTLLGATGTGKTRVAMALIKLLVDANIIRNVLFQIPIPPSLKCFYFLVFYYIS